MSIKNASEADKQRYLEDALTVYRTTFKREPTAIIVPPCFRTAIRIVLNRGSTATPCVISHDADPIFITEGSIRTSSPGGHFADAVFSTANVVLPPTAFGGFFPVGTPPANPEPREAPPSYELVSDEEAVAQLVHARTYQSSQEALASLRKRGYEIVKRVAETPKEE